MDIPATRSGLPEVLKQRVITAAIAVLVLFAVLYALPVDAARAVIVAVILTAAWEWSGLLSLPGNGARFAYVGLIAVLQAGVLALTTRGLLPDTVFMVALLWWFCALCWLCVYPTRVPRALCWLAGILVIVPAWLALDTLYRLDATLLLFMLVIVSAADIGAYFAGRRYGRLKLAPRLSPGKTWEGVLGGLLLVTVLVMARAVWVGNELAVLVPFCLAVAMLSVVGDLTVSLFKRNAGVKDSGSLFPGHGGLLDRIDSVAAAAPLFALGIGELGLR